MHPDKAVVKTDALKIFYSEKWENDSSLIRVELDGYGFTLKKDGSIIIGDGAYDLTKSYRYEKGISIIVKQEYSLGGTIYEFDSEMYTVEEVFVLATTMYGEKYRQYLDTKNDKLFLPTINEKWSQVNPDDESTDNFESVIENDVFKSFRIDENDGCYFWLSFEIENGLIRFGSGDGC